jgi:hypothetical protein
LRLVLDAGALIALDRSDREMWSRLKIAQREGTGVITHGGIIGQAWRGGGTRQARLAHALNHVEVRPVDRALGRAAGALLARTRLSDVIDAALVLIAEDDDLIFTSDPDDLTSLIQAAELDLELIQV